MTKALNSESSTCSGIAYTKKYVKQLLKNITFVGSFEEKRFVDSLCSYRDIIKVCDKETKFIKNLQVVKKKLDFEIITKSWIGITSPGTIGAPLGWSLWVVLPEEVFGKYWYRVKTVEFLDNEIRLKLEIVRCYEINYSTLENYDEVNESISFIIQEKKQLFLRNFTHFLRHELTWKNIKLMTIFLLVLISSLFAGVFSIMKYLLEYLLKLIREFSGLIVAITPLITHMVNFMGKCIFGLYQLIYAIFQDRRPRGPVYNQYVNYIPNAGLLMPNDRPNALYQRPAIGALSYRPVRTLQND